MKKLFAIVLALALMLSACAFADGVELLLNNLSVSILQNGQSSAIDLSGINLRLAFAHEPKASGLRLGLDAADETLINAVATIGTEEILFSMDGLSNIYSVPLEAVSGSAMPSIDPAQIAPTLEALGDDLDNFFAGMEFAVGEPTEIYGETYDTRTIHFSAEQLQELALLFTDFAETLPAEWQQIILQGSGYASLREALAANPNTLDLECSIHTLEDKFALIATLRDAQKADSALYGQFICLPGTDDASSTPYTTVTGGLMELHSEEASEEIFNFGFTVNQNSETGGFHDLFGNVYFPVEDAVIPNVENMEDVLADPNFIHENYDGFSFGLLSPEANQGVGLWALYFASMDETIYLHFACSDPQEEYSFCEFLLTEEDTTLMLSLQQTAERSASIYGGFFEGSDGAEIAFDAAIQGVDTGWAAIDGSNAINALEMTEAQARALGLQLSAVGLNALSDLAKSNPMIGALVGSLSGGM